MAVILLPIKPEYCDRILSGTKKYEYRRHLPSERIEKIIIYATAPVKKVLGEVQVVDTISMKKTPLWESTKEYAGISREKYREYFNNISCAHAFVLGVAKRYAEPLELKEFGLKTAPQSFAYLSQCPFCGNVITHTIKDTGLSTSKSEEHIIPFSLGNDQIVLPKGVVCDGCNNYFAIKIENEFLANETIVKLRSFHTIPSRKGKIPDLEILFAGEKTKLEIDAKNNCAYIGLQKETIDQLIMNKIDSFFSSGIDVEPLKNNYSVSRFLVKVFLESCLYYSIQDRHTKLHYAFDAKMKELVKYVRIGDKNERLYNYSVLLEKDPLPLSNDDFIASVRLKINDKKILCGMVFKLYELTFDLTI